MPWQQASKVRPTGQVRASSDWQTANFVCVGGRFVLNCRCADTGTTVSPNLIMLTEAESNTVVEKTRELCSTILAQPGMNSIRQNIDNFMADEKSRSQYESLMAKGQELHEKQHRSLPLSGEEIGEFEKQRETVLSNPVARGFLDAQQALHELQETVTQQITKTLELGRLPKEEDFEQGSCGHGCGCGSGHEH